MRLAVDERRVKKPKVRTFEVMERAVEEGVARGWRRAHKHTDAPGQEIIVQYIEREVMSAIAEVFDLED